MELHKNIKTYYAASVEDWHNWLKDNHLIEKSIFLICYKKESKVPTITYYEALEEALCFGWIDSKINKRDDLSFYQYFAKRNPKSNWSRVNKQKIESLISQNRLFPAGLEMVELAKKNGTWNALDAVENLEIPIDLEFEFQKNPVALEHFNQFSRSTKRAILEWLFNAKKEETRAKRIQEILEQSKNNLKPSNFQ